MTPVELPYVPILLNETFITALWDTGAEKSFISEEVYRNYFSYRPRQKTKDRVVTAQGAPCSHLGRVELQIRIREFQKPWEFHILDNMQYQCILGIDFMKASRLTLDFHQKSLIIPDHLIKQTPKEEKLVDIDLTESKLDDEQQKQLKALFNNFKGLFSDQPGLTHVVYHEIDTGDKGPVVSRPYKYDRVKQGIIDYHIDKMLQDGTICPINSPYASPVVLTRKNNDLPPDSPEAYRFAIDYRKLNGITKYPRYPLPVIDDLLTNIPHTNVMSTLDLRSGYFQLAISPKDIEKTAFITRNGTFAFLRMPFGLSGAAPNFQRAIDIILQPVIGRFVSVYMDDVIITSPSFKDHLDHLTRVFTLLRDAGLTLNKEKCHFARDKLKYLGLIISKEGIETDNKKIRAITEMKPPKNNREFNLFTDASGVGIGAVLQQNQKLIAFASRTLNKAERNYTVTERECLAVIWALNKFKTYFGPLPVKVITDHAALTKLTNGKNLSSRTIRWALKLSEFNIEWEHRPGVQNVVADLLSRNPVDSVEGSQISCAALRALAINSREQFIKEQREDPELGHIYRYLENPDDGSVNATVRVYRPRQSDTISSDSPVETLYDEQEVSHGSNRSHQGQFKEHRKTSSQESEGCRSRQGNTTREIPRNKRKINSTASKDQALKRSKICRKRSRQGSDHQDRKRHAPEQGQGVKRVESIAGPSRLPDRRTATTTGGSRMEVSGRDNQTRQTRATTRRRKEQAEKPVRSNQTNTRRPCPYYLRSRIQEKDGIPEEMSNIEINGIPGSTFRRRSLSMEALNGDPVHRI
ncbi:retrovirus-related Pol polyprotein from transposon 297 [Trichonephila clavipes]|nr:retrovirus-related Pol polyprotein from transposon 297 [Trichonephila clavipes]